MSQSLYNRYRPQAFSNITGQSAAVEVLSRVASRGNPSHAYLFSGPRGCGKTTTARVLAKALNCLNLKENGDPCNGCCNCLSITEGKCLDVVEIDGASNNGVDAIRDLKAHVDLAPISCPWKIYIVDEVHMLSAGAFNAFLKTLEEPPSHVVFILATTNPSKVPVTVRSRCQQIPFRSINVRDMAERLSKVAESEKAAFDKEAIWEIGRLADGSLRDGLSLMEQALILGDGTIDEATVAKITGGGTYSELCRWVKSFSLQAESLESLSSMFQRGASVEDVAKGLYRIFRDMWIARLWGEKGLSALEVSPWEREFLKESSLKWDEIALRKVMDLLVSLLPEARRGLEGDVFVGMVLSSLIPPSDDLKPLEVSTVPLDFEKSVLKTPEEPEAEKKLNDKKFQPTSQGEDIFLEGNFSKAPHIISALAFCSLEKDGKNLSVLVPDERPYSFELLKGDRNAYILQSMLSEEGTDGRLSISWKGKTKDFLPLDQIGEDSKKDESSNDKDKKYKFKDKVKTHIGAKPQGPQGENAGLLRSEGPAEELKGLEGIMKAMKSQMSLDLLYVRKEDDMERDSEEESSEEGDDGLDGGGER